MDKSPLFMDKIEDELIKYNVKLQSGGIVSENDKIILYSESLHLSTEYELSKLLKTIKNMSLSVIFRAKLSENIRIRLLLLVTSSNAVIFLPTELHELLSFNPLLQIHELFIKIPFETQLVQSLSLLHDMHKFKHLTQLVIFE